MLDSLRQDVTQRLSRIEPASEEEQQRMIDQMMAQQRAAQEENGDAVETNAPSVNPDNGFSEDDPSTWGNPGRNDACPCGSGEKFKHCHGRLT